MTTETMFDRGMLVARYQLTDEMIETIEYGCTNGADGRARWVIRSLIDRGLASGSSKPLRGFSDTGRRLFYAPILTDEGLRVCAALRGVTRDEWRLCWAGRSTRSVVVPLPFESDDVAAPTDCLAMLSGVVSAAVARDLAGMQERAA